MFNCCRSRKRWRKSVNKTTESDEEFNYQSAYSIVPDGVIETADTVMKCVPDSSVAAEKNAASIKLTSSIVPHGISETANIESDAPVRLGFP